MINEHWGFRVGERITVPGLWGEQLGTVIDFATMQGRNAGRIAHVVVYRLDDGRVSSDTPERLFRLNHHARAFGGNAGPQARAA
ncbi:hypothetical protein D3874_15130 [Oleomonas cavernae]|uniref:Uncharacterized protein n=1 Tax=Oleomonas cavernae TaxID=2320859 RepID=A0A418WDT7_9PROT|nr:hypothetical protein [Oleomonas cavernae]RJF88183.1 hypothetical protein D3874_15130 [Oleomonas cavernae]